MSKLIDDIKNAERARRALTSSPQPPRGVDEPLSATMARAAGIDTAAGSIPAQTERDATQRPGKEAEIADLAQVRTEQLALGMTQARVIVEAAAKRRSDARAAAEQQALAAAMARAELEAALQRQIADRIAADRAATAIANERAAADQRAIEAALRREAAEFQAKAVAMARTKADADAQRIAQSRLDIERHAQAVAPARSAADSLAVDAAAARVQAERDAELAATEKAVAQARTAADDRAKVEARRAPDGASEIASGTSRAPGFSIWRRSPRLTRFAGIAAALMVGIGIGDWRGRNAGTTYSGVTAPDVPNLSAAVPRDFQLRLDDKFENFDRHFVLRVPSGR